MSEPATILLVRHGQTVWNSQKRWQGQKNSPLTAKGRAGATALGQRLCADGGVDIIFSSDLGRTLETAALIAAELNNPPATLTDVRLHDLAGKKDKLELLARMRAGEGVGGAESKVEIRDRMLEVVTEIAEKNRGKKVLIVSHGAVTAAFMREVMHLDPMFDPSPVVVNNTSLTTLQLSDQTDDNQGGAKTNAFWKVLCLGDTSHQDAWLAVQIEEAKAAASTQTLLLTAAIVTAAALIRASLSP
eukprot:gene8161-15103_t